jgi:7-carboxy-7-deazaguanine synthase
MKINEIFYSIQGEGKWAGLPNIFIRTTGCNLRCAYCDTKYAYEDGKDLEIKEIINNIKKIDCKYVCITGGEPLLNKDILNLISYLIKDKYFVIIETNGSISIDDIIRFQKLVISLDIKCPSSDMDKKNKFENINLLEKKDQIKFVIRSKEDYNFAKKILNKYEPRCEVFFQPVWGENPKKIADWLLSDKLNVKLGLQFHKIIWGEKNRE